MYDLKYDFKYILRNNAAYYSLRNNVIKDSRNESISVISLLMTFLL